LIKHNIWIILWSLYVRAWMRDYIQRYTHQYNFDVVLNNLVYTHACNVLEYDFICLICLSGQRWPNNVSTIYFALSIPGTATCKCARILAIWQHAELYINFSKNNIWWEQTLSCREFYLLWLVRYRHFYGYG
jgi:hypothetical protein